MECVNDGGQNEKDNSVINSVEIGLRGTLSKWTNYIQGWQNRFVVIKGGNLTYYKSEVDQPFQCRGVLCLNEANIKSHELDECRFDVSIRDHTWYFRAASRKDKEQWVETLQEARERSPCQICNHQSRSEICLSIDSPSIFDSQLHEEVKEFLVEMTTHEGILKNQLEILQGHFDFLAEQEQYTNSSTSKEKHAKQLSLADIKREAFSFRITSEAILSILRKCMDKIAKAQESWTNEGMSLSKLQLSNDQIKMASGPDNEEGPHCTIQEDEFYDSLEFSFQRIEEEASLRELLKKNSVCQLPPTSNSASEHPLWPEIERVTKEQLQNAAMDMGEGAWQAVHVEGDLRMYTKELERDGTALDPLRVYHEVRGVTAREVCHYFFGPQYRQDWETTLERMEVKEKISEDILVFHQVYKRVWPAAQRDSLFWSHRVHDGGTWAVVNNSTDNPKFEQNCNYVRASLTVCLYCQNVAPTEDGSTSRDDISCRLRYCSTVNPGGWAPAFALRAIFRKEYPKFMKRFCKYVINETKDKPISM